MRYFLIIPILLFYIFFLLRALTLSKALGKNIKANSSLLNMSILLVGISTVIFLAFLTAPAYLIASEISEYFLILSSSILLKIIGSVLITLGSTTSIIASLTSWPIGVDENEIAKLITDGINKISKYPYFLSCDLVLVGIIAVQNSEEADKHILI
jgi:hypothetical protein